MKKIILIIVVLFITPIVFAQNSLAKIEYSYAEEAFNKKEFSKAIQHLEEVKSLLGSTNARILYLEILSRSNNLPNYQAFNDSIGAGDNKSDGTIDAAIFQAIMSLGAGDNTKSLIPSGTISDINLNNTTKTIDALNKENTNSEINNWLESVELINSLSDIYVENFENDVPLEKLKKVYEIKKHYKIFIPNRELIKQSWETLKKKDYENALIKFKELQIAGIESSAVISEIQAMIQFEQLGDKAISNIENNMVFVKGDANTNVPDLYVSKYEVTRKEWFDIMSIEIPKLWIYYGETHQPITNLRGRVEIFIAALNEKSEKKYRLPTKEEWYWFATGGLKTSDKERGINKEKSKNIFDYAWCKKNSRYRKKDVGVLKPNELGLFDIWGNVLEFTTTNEVGGSYRTKKAKMIKGDSYVSSYMLINESRGPAGIRLVITSN